eukprot:SAG11_NODE_275_length_11309_cov_6.090901_12_plen_60_part_00
MKNPWSRDDGYVTEVKIAAHQIDEVQDVEKRACEAAGASHRATRVRFFRSNLLLTDDQE